MGTSAFRFPVLRLKQLTSSWRRFSVRPFQHMDTHKNSDLPNDKAAYGGFWIRFAATVVDTVVLLIPTLLASFLYRSVASANSELEKVFVDLCDFSLNFAIWWVYIAALLSSTWQATIGKRVCGLRVVDYNGQRISFGRATGRYFASILSSALFCIGFFMIAWAPRRQGLHDSMASTLVIKTCVATNHDLIG